MPTRELPLLLPGIPVYYLLDAKLTAGELSGLETPLEVWHSESSFHDILKDTLRGLYLGIKHNKIPSV